MASSKQGPMWSSSGQRFGDVNEPTTFEGFSATEESGLIRGPRPDRFTPVLWFSPDGQRWTGVGLQEAIGVDDFPTEFVVGEDTIILRWSGYSFLGDDEEFEEAYGDHPPDVIRVGRVEHGGG